MARWTRVERLEYLQRKLKAIPQRVKTATRLALVQNQREFMTRLAVVVGTGDPRNGHLISSIEGKNGEHELELLVSIGNEQFPYPFHLEVGHKAPDGSMVPAKPAFYPLIRVTRKKFTRRATSAARKAIKSVTAGG